MIGVYFLRKGKKVVYVGQSIDIHRRIKEHKQEKTKKFDNFTYVECNKNLLSTTEEAFILKFNPVFNIKKAEFSTIKKDVDGYKIIKVEDETHLQIKIQASQAGMSIKDYLQFLADKDKQGEQDG